ncbi:MAG TPA: zinc ribbon domain-containing protein [Candidatus Binatia bacterium]|nr:zinc ribbon domain-containing protein [Candidatus Binatia bacterium]
MKFCGQCGTQLGNRCAQCGFDNPLGFQFCGQCGVSLTRRSKGDRAKGGKGKKQSSVRRLASSV